MDKETLSNYGWIIILVLILAVLLALASPFGLFVSDAIKGATGGFWEVNSKALNVAGIDTNDVIFTDEPAACGIEGHYKCDKRKGHGVPVTECKKGHTYECECDGWIIPEGGKYYVGITTSTIGDYTGTTKTYDAGEKLPCGYTPIYGDVFVLGDYEYRYNAYCALSSDVLLWSRNVYQGGWGVRVLNDTKNTYGEILNTIANKPVNSLIATFYNCKNLRSTPVISNTVTNINSAFQNCTTLTATPQIPNSVTNMMSSFYNCYLLETPPNLKADLKVSNMSYTFNNCTSLKTAPVIPKDVEGMYRTFCNCTSLITPPDMSKMTKIQGLKQTFWFCKSLETPPVIPNTVTDMQQTFADCPSLKTAPVIPNGVTNMSGTFLWCSSLKNAPVIPSNVTNMNSTFYGCGSLTGEIEINANPSTYGSCFYLVYFMRQNVTLEGDSLILDEIGLTGHEYCTNCNGICLNNH